MAAPKPKAKKAAETNVMADGMNKFPLMNPQVWQEIMSESAAFMTERLKKDLETQQAMLTCKSPVELIKIQSEFVQETLTDYTEEATRMYKLLTNTHGTARDYDDVPL